MQRQTVEQRWWQQLKWHSKQQTANSRAGRGRSENPLFQSMGAEEDAEADSWSEVVAAATKATMEMARRWQ